MKRTTRRIENIKSFSSEMALMDLVESLSATPVKIARDPNIFARLTKNENKMELELDDCSLEYADANYEKQKSVSIILHDKNYLISSLDLQSPDTDTEVKERVNYREMLSIYAFETVGFRDEKLGKFKTFIPLDPEKMRRFDGEFETVTYQEGGNEYLFDCLRCELEEDVFDIVQFKKGDKGFYVIECLNDLDLDIYKDYCFAIQQALGFISGYMPGGEQYIFSSSLEMYYINHLRPAIKSMYNPICTTPYARLPSIELADKYYSKLTRIPPAVLSNLILAIKNNENLSSAILLLLESSSIRSILLIPSGFSVIIESLSKIISIPEQGVEFPIEDLSLKEIIINELTEIINKHSDALNQESVTKLKNRLREINRPINKEHLTNNEKLTQPFYQLQIALSAEDIAAIEHRNDVLHGNILMKNDGQVKTLEETNNYMLYISGKLYTLISKLLLKYLGYDGLVYNHSKHCEKYVGIETSEEYFEKI